MRNGYNWDQLPSALELDGRPVHVDMILDDERYLATTMGELHDIAVRVQWQRDNPVAARLEWLEKNAAQLRALYLDAEDGRSGELILWFWYKPPHLPWATRWRMGAERLVCSATPETDHLVLPHTPMVCVMADQLPSVQGRRHFSVRVIREHINPDSDIPKLMRFIACGQS